MTVNAVAVKYWNEIANERQLAHVIRPGDGFGTYDPTNETFSDINPTNRIAVDIHSLHRDLNVFGGELIGQVWLSSIEDAAKTGKTLRIPCIPRSDYARIDGETAKNLLGAIRRKLNPSEVFAFLDRKEKI